MKFKGTTDVIEALTKFFNEVKDVKVLRSDQDTAYLSNKTLEFLREKCIRYLTTEDENHNILGIINRFMRNIRDHVGKEVVDEEEMKEFLDMYNTSIHSSTNAAPVKMTKNQEKEYIMKKRIETQNKTRGYDFKPGDRVRIIIEAKALSKKRSNLSSKSYIVDSRSGNMFLIKAMDHSVDYYPDYKLVLCSKSIPLAETLKDEKRGVIERIESYVEKRNKIRVKYEGGVHDFIPVKNFREGEQLKLSSMERAFWVHKELPPKIKKYV